MVRTSTNMATPFGVLVPKFLRSNGEVNDPAGDAHPAIIGPNGQKLATEKLNDDYVEAAEVVSENDDGTITVRLRNNAVKSLVEKDVMDLLDATPARVPWPKGLKKAMCNGMAAFIILYLSRMTRERDEARKEVLDLKNLPELQSLKSQLKYALRDKDKAIESARTFQEQSVETFNELRLLKAEFAMTKDRADSNAAQLEHHRTNSEEARRERNRALERLREVEEKYLEQRKATTDLTGQNEKLKLQLAAKEREYEDANKALNAVVKTWTDYGGSPTANAVLELVKEMGLIAQRAAR